MFLTAYGLGLISGFMFILFGFWYLKKLDKDSEAKQEDINSQLIKYWKMSNDNHVAQIKAIETIARILGSK